MAVRMYGLFEKVDGKWVRLKPAQAYKKPTAVRVFQNDLLAGFFGGDGVKGERALRPIPKEKPAPAPEPESLDEGLSRIRSMFTIGAVLAHKAQ